MEKEYTLDELHNAFKVWNGKLDDHVYHLLKQMRLDAFGAGYEAGHQRSRGTNDEKDFV